MVALGAAEETYLALIGGTELAEPPDCQVVLAFRALDLDGGHGFWLSLIFHNDDLIFTAVYRALHLIGTFNLPDIPAFPALELASRRYKHSLAFRTEHRYIIE